MYRTLTSVIWTLLSRFQLGRCWVDLSFIEQNGVAAFVDRARTDKAKVIEFEHATACEVRVGDHGPRDAEFRPSARPGEGKCDGVTADAPTGRGRRNPVSNHRTSSQLSQVFESDDAYDDIGAVENGELDG